MCAFADTFVTQVAEPYARIIANAKTPAERSSGMQIRLNQGLAAITDASGPNPAGNLLDLVVLVTLQRASIEEYWIPHLLHGDGADLLAAYKQSEAEAWQLAGVIFTDQQVVDLKNFITKWKRDNPAYDYTAGIRLTNFIRNTPASNKAQILASSLLGVLDVDPLKGLDPVTQEAERYRILTERLVYISMRAQSF